MIQIRDAVERTLVVTGAAIIVLHGAGNRGVTNWVLEPEQRLRTQCSYNLVDAVTGHSLSAECTAVPGGGMQIASFHLNN